MATYFHTPNNQREPRAYSQESWQGSDNEPSQVLPPHMMVYMNYLSSGNTNELSPPQHEIFSSLPAPPRMCYSNDLSAWGNERGEMPIMPLLGSATSLLQGVQNLQSQSQGQCQGLSLSLSTQIPPTIHIPPIELRNQNLGAYSSFSGPNNSPSNPLGDDENPSNYGVTSVGRTLPNSKYLKAARELLDEVVNVRNALKKPDRKKEVLKSGEEEKGESEVSSNKQDISSSSVNELAAAEKQDLQNKLSKLLTMLDEVDRKYKQYYHQMQIVVSSFDVISGPGAACPYTTLALQTISCHFRTLRDAIINQIKSVQKSLGEKDSSDDGKGVKISRLRFVDQHLKQQRALQQMGMMQQQWRPQRGLPERSVSILRAWLFEHFLHPYPKDSEKLMLARQTGLTRSQVSNWFINARVRLWKPMVEEMYKEEAGDAEIDSTSSPETGNRSSKGDTKPSDDRDNQDIQQNANSSSEKSKKAQLLESKQVRVSSNNQRQDLGPCLDDAGLFQGYQVPGFGRLGNSNSVSLTLGLQGGSLPIPVNQNFTIYNTESSTMGSEMADFEMDSENRQHRYGLRDFVA